MSPLTTLDGIEEGHDIAILTGGLIQRWQVTANGGLIRNGHTLEQFFLTGLLAAERVVDGDFSPPQPGEWFTWRSRVLLVVELDGARVRVAQFRNGNFNQWSEVSDLVERGSRIPAPEWAGTEGAFYRMCLMAWTSEKASERTREQARKANQARDYIRYVIDYATTAQGLMQP